MTYDLLVIGDEREGIDRAISAAREGRRVAVIGARDTIPSLDVLQRAADHLAELPAVTMAAWRAEVTRLTRCQMLADCAEMECLGIDRVSGKVQFVSETSIEVVDCGESRVLSGARIVVACGTRSRLPASLQCDGRFVLGVESLLELDDVPQSVIVVGAGETGLAAAILLAKLGVEVTVVDEHVSLREVCGIFDGSFDAVQSLQIAFRLGDEVIGTERRLDLQAAVRLSSGGVLTADAILICVGREGKTDGMNLEVAGVGLDERGRLWCDARGQTWSSRIVAVGDIVGFSCQSARLRTDGRLLTSGSHVFRTRLPCHDDGHKSEEMEELGLNFTLI